MHLVILNQYALPAGSAGITRHGDIGAEFVRRGHEVTVIASDFNYLARQPRGGPAASEHDGVRFVWLRTGSYAGNDARRVRSMMRFATAATGAAIRVSPRPDVIIGSSPNLLAPMSAAIAARLLRRPWVFEVRDFWPSALVDLGAISKGGRAHRVLETLERRLYRSADAVVTVPPNGSERLAELGTAPDRCVHIPNATALDMAGSVPVPPTAEAILSDLGQRFLITYTGQLGVTHDLATVLAGLAHLRDSNATAYERAAVLFVGDGIERPRIEQAAARLRLDNVRFHGAMAKASVASVLEQADACLMQIGSSDYFRYGLSPNKLFDYFAAGKPVLIASDHPTPADEGGAGLRYRPGDPVAFGNAVVRMMELAPEERAAMGNRGRELARTRYSIRAVTDQYEELLQGLVSERG